MRKYQQLGLLILSIFSVSMFLIYRHEYNRLYNVLEVFNFFGQPCNYSELIEQDTIISHHDWGPQPIWTKDDSIMIYSSFRIKFNEVVSLIMKETKTDHPKTCYLWVNDNKMNRPLVGKIHYKQFGQENRLPYEMFEYYCTYGGILDVVPFAVSYSKRRIIRHNINNIYDQEGAKHSTHNANMTICIMDKNGEMTVGNLAEFLSYHKLLGINSYITYSTTSLPYKTMKLLQNLQGILKYNITFFPYNSMHYDDKLIETDCFLRTKSGSNYTIALNINEYISLPAKHNLFNIIKSIDTFRLNLPIVKFCVEKTKTNTPIALQSIHSIRDSEQLIKNLNINKLYNESNNTGTNSGLISVNKYIDCINVKKTYIDDVLLQYSNNFIKSTLVQMNIHKLL